MGLTSFNSTNLLLSLVHYLIPIFSRIFFLLSCLRWESQCFSHLSEWNKVDSVAQAKDLGFILGSSFPSYRIYHPVILILIFIANRLSLLRGHLVYYADPPFPSHSCPLQLVLYSHVNELKNMETLSVLLKLFLAFLCWPSRPFISGLPPFPASPSQYLTVTLPMFLHYTEFFLVSDCAWNMLS